MGISFLEPYKNSIIMVGNGLSALYIFTNSDLPIIGSSTRIFIFGCCLLATVVFAASYVYKGQAEEEEPDKQTIDSQTRRYFYERAQPSVQAKPHPEVDIKKELEKTDKMFQLVKGNQPQPEQQKQEEKDIFEGFTR